MNGRFFVLVEIKIVLNHKIIFLNRLLIESNTQTYSIYEILEIRRFLNLINKWTNNWKITTPPNILKDERETNSLLKKKWCITSPKNITVINQRKNLVNLIIILNLSMNTLLQNLWNIKLVPSTIRTLLHISNHPHIL